MFKSQVDALKKLTADIRADYELIASYKIKYAKDSANRPSMATLLVNNIGFQSQVAIRCMHCARDFNIPFGEKIVSRIIRHLYGMEVHWDAKLAPGIYLVHGNGIVVSSAATVESGSIIMQNVTLGWSRDPKTQEAGAPKIGKDVVIGPGATLLGPITVGDGTKVLAGAVLTQSVPQFSLVKPADATISTRPKKTNEKEVSHEGS